MFTARSVISLVLLAGCASTSGAQPHDMSVVHHEAAASSHETEAGRHAAQYDAAARAARERCMTATAGTAPTDACWTSVTNPTTDHLREAERHRRMAVDHRAASQALRDAEARACAGLRDDDRDTSPFAHREDIAGVAPLTEPTTSGRVTSQRSVGAVVTFRALPGMTAEWLQRVIDCHVARGASLGHEVPEMPYCPLSLREVQARVTSTGNGFAVAIRADDPATVEEILRRARALTSPRAASGTSP